MLMSGMGSSFDDVGAAADEQVADHLACDGAVDHFVHPNLVGTRAALEEEVVQQVELQVAAREDVRAVPGTAHRVERQRGLAARDEVEVIAGVDGRPERRCRRIRIPLRRPGQQQVDRVGYQLDVAVLLGGDVRDEIVERLQLAAAAEVERLERVVHQRRHFAELAAEQLLHG